MSTTRTSSRDTSDDNDGGWIKTDRNTTIPTMDQLNVLHQACVTSEEAVEALIHHITTMDIPGYAPEDLPAIRQETMDMFMHDPTKDPGRAGGYLPLHYACQSGFPKAVKLLLKHGADVNARKNNGSTAIMCAITGAARFASDDIPGKAYLRQTFDIIDTLMTHPGFDLDANDDISKGCSPVFVCVNRPNRGRDCLLPLLEMLLSKGFSPNPAMHGFSALHCALRFNHTKSAFALVKAGADITNLAPASVEGDDEDIEGDWTALDLCRHKFGNYVAKEMQEAYRLAQAVAGPKSRMKHLRNANKNVNTSKSKSKKNKNNSGKAKNSGGDQKILAKKACAAAEAFCKTKQWSLAAGAFEEALSYPYISASVGKKRAKKEKAVMEQRKMRFVVHCNLCTAYTQISKFEEAVRCGRLMVDEYPNSPMAKIILGNSLWSQSEMKNDPPYIDNSDEVAKLIEDIDGVLGLRDFREDELDQLGSVMGNMTMEQKRQAAALGPNVKPMFMKQWDEPADENSAGIVMKGLEALRELKFNNGRDNMNPGVKAASIALELFNTDGDIFEAVKKIDEALDPKNCHPKPRAMRSIRASIYYECGCQLLGVLAAQQRLNDGPVPWLDMDGHGYKVKDRFDIAKEKFQISMKEFIKCTNNDDRGFEWYSGLSMIALGRFDRGFPCCFNGIKEFFKMETQLENSFLEKETNRTTLHPFARGAFLCAKAFTSGHSSVDALTDEQLRKKESEFDKRCAEVIVTCVLDTKRNHPSTPTRVLGTMVTEALQWDPDVVLPHELDRAQRKVSGEQKCSNCGQSGELKGCPCGAVRYCSKECQRKDWKTHRGICTAAR